MIHCEESEAAYQHFYPLSLLRQYTSKLIDKYEAPSISCRLPPARTLKKKFIFPAFIAFTDLDPDQDQEFDTQPDSPISVDMSPRDVVTEDDAGSITIVNGNSHPTTGSSISIQGTSSLLAAFTTVSTSLVSSALPVPENPNPYPAPPWYPESAHFVRQWWPSLLNIPRVSCTVVLLAAHDEDTHRTRFVLAQHYFRVPLNRREWANESDARGQPSSSSLLSSSIPVTNGTQPADGRPKLLNGKSDTYHSSQPCVEELQDDALMHLWYVSTPFDVVRVFDGAEEEEDGTFAERPRPLVAVDFGHAVWIEYVDGDDAEMEDEERRHVGDFDDFEEDDSVMDTPTGAMPITALTDSEPKRLRFVTFPPFVEETGVTSRSKTQFSSMHRRARPSALSYNTYGVNSFPRGVVHTLPTPPGLQLGLVETINIDQSQGAVILSDKGGKIWILCYE